MAIFSYIGELLVDILHLDGFICKFIYLFSYLLHIVDYYIIIFSFMAGAPHSNWIAKQKYR